MVYFPLTIPIQLARLLRPGDFFQDNFPVKEALSFWPQSVPRTCPDPEGVWNASLGGLGPPNVLGGGAPEVARFPSCQPPKGPCEAAGSAAGAVMAFGLPPCTPYALAISVMHSVSLSWVTARWSRNSVMQSIGLG